MASPMGMGGMMGGGASMPAGWGNGTMLAPGLSRGGLNGAGIFDANGRQIADGAWGGGNAANGGSP
jgi:hypothetical protein